MSQILLHFSEFTLPAHLIRHGLRRATFPKGEGFGMVRPKDKLQFINLLHSYKKSGRVICRIFDRVWNYSWGPAATRALPSSLPVYLVKFFWKRSARSFALVSHSAASA